MNSLAQGYARATLCFHFDFGETTKVLKLELSRNLEFNVKNLI